MLSGQSGAISENALNPVEELGKGGETVTALNPVVVELGKRGDTGSV